jgi:peroxiredoxin
LRSFQHRLAEFDSRGVRVVAISVDSPQTNRDHREKLGLTFPLLSDESGEVSRRYDLFHAAGGPSKSAIARPAEFLVDSTGKVRWANLTSSVTVRARPEQVLKAFDEMNLKPR